MCEAVYDGDLSLPLGLALGSQIFPSGCEGKLGVALESLHFSLSCIGEGNGNPLQCSCLENPRDRGAWWAALYSSATPSFPSQPEGKIWLPRANPRGRLRSPP